MERTYTVKEVAEILGYSTNSIYTFIKEKRITGIRVGMGRFRITQEELNRLLNLKKTTSPALQSSVSPALEKISANKTTIPTINRHVENSRLSTPSLFDWFVSMSSVMIGFGMFLFTDSATAINALVLSAIRLILVLVGGTLFARYTSGKGKKGTSMGLCLLVGLAYLFLSIALFLNSNINSGVLFGLLALTIFIQLIFFDKKFNFFLIYFSLVSIFLPIFIYTYPGDLKLTDYGFLLYFSGWSAILTWFILASLSCLFIWVVKTKNNIGNFIFISLLSLALVLIACLYGQSGHWERAYLLIFTAIFGFLIPHYRDIEKNGELHNLTFFNSFFQTLSIAIIILFLLFITQNNQFSSSKADLLSELAYGKQIVEDSLQTGKEQVKNLSKDSSLVSSIESGDKASINQSIKDLFINSSLFRRVMVADKNGNVLSIYPQAVIDNTNVSFRDYFTQTKELKDSVITDPLEVMVNGVKRQSIALTAPIMDKGQFLGIVIGSFDLDKLSNLLQKYSNQPNKYFEIIDKTGQIFVKPSYLQLKSTLDKGSAVWNGFNGSYGAVEETQNNKRMLVSYDHMSLTNWVISIGFPATDILAYGTSSIIIAAFILLVTSLFIIYVNLKQNRRV